MFDVNLNLLEINTLKRKLNTFFEVILETSMSANITLSAKYMMCIWEFE